MANRERTEGYKGRRAAVEVKGGPFTQLSSMSRAEYAKINPLFDRLKHMQAALKRKTRREEKERI